MKKIISILLIALIIIPLGGCEFLDQYFKKPTNSAVTEEPEKETDFPKKITKKVINCTGSVTEEGFTMDEDINIYFENDQATTMEFSYIYDFGVTGEQLDELLETFDFEEEIINIFADMGVDDSLFTAHAERLENNNIKVTISGEYLDLIKALNGEGVMEKKYYDISYNNVYDYMMNEEAPANDLTCNVKED